MTTFLRVDNPATGEVAFETPYAHPSDIGPLVQRAQRAQRIWAHTPLAERQRVVLTFAELALAHQDALALSISQQMGKPLTQAQGEVRTMAARARRMAELAPQALADRLPPEQPGFIRAVRRVPVGVVVNVAPWNYPLLTVINALSAAVLAGNAFIIKPSPRTPESGFQIASLFEKAGGPAGLVQAVLLDHWAAAGLLQHPGVNYAAFTGSVRGGREVYRTVAEASFAGVGLELGGKDAAYVAADANLDHAVPNVVEGAMYNSGQSCCAVERVYVARPLYSRFLEAAAEALNDWQPGDPLEPTTALGPMALPTALPFLQSQLEQARLQGARVIAGGAPLQLNGHGRYFAPTLVEGASQDSAIVQEESFGPLLAIIPVDSDEDAVRHINDSRYGLTASLWTTDLDRAQRLAPKLEVGTVFMNRCDYLDPDLPWTGYKDSGLGSTLGIEGFAPFTRPQALHFRTKIA